MPQQLEDILAQLFFDLNQISKRLETATIRHNQELCELGDELTAVRSRIERLRGTVHA